MFLAALLFACNNDGGTGNDDPKDDPADSAYKSPNTYQVAVFDNYTVREATRNRNIKILLRYPRNAPSPLPVIIWSHGGGPNPNGQNSYNEWGEALAGAEVDFSPSVHNVQSFDIRFSAFLACSPQGICRLGMTANSWSNIPVPMMVQTGAADVTTGEDAAGRLDSFDRMPPPAKYLLYLDSPATNHATFGLNPNTGDVKLEPYVSAAGIAFFDAYLRNLADAKTRLASNKVETWSNGVAKMTVK